MAFLIYILLALAFTLGAYQMEGGRPQILIQPAELIMIVLPALFLSLAATSGEAFSLSWKLLFGSPAKPETRKVKQACRYLRVYGNTSAIMGCIAAVVGFVITCGSGQMPSWILMEKLGAAAVALVIGGFLKAICYVAEKRIEDRYLGGESQAA